MSCRYGEKPRPAASSRTRRGGFEFNFNRRNRLALRNRSLIRATALYYPAAHCDAFCD
jgi:hypothetical protein